ncbi:MAG: HAD family hydrolase [Candidatus Levybacteria bacterium]|nr:HAD family hydrolase [Candidatus Levybacteria bacterium]
MGVHVKVGRPAVFLDRDGTLVAQVDDIINSSQLKILSGVPDGVRLLNRLGFLVIVITNQPVIGKGLTTRTKVKKINKVLYNWLSKKGAIIDAFYVCPHRHWDRCACRKPKLGLINAAVKKYNIDITNSFFIGDDMRDIETGKRARLKTILVKTGNAGRDRRYFDVKPNAIVRNFLFAAKFIARVRK